MKLLKALLMKESKPLKLTWKCRGSFAFSTVVKCSAFFSKQNKTGRSPCHWQECSQLEQLLQMQAIDNHVDPWLYMPQPIPTGYFLTVHLTHAGITATGRSTLTLAQIKRFSVLSLLLSSQPFFFTAFKSLALNVLLFDLVKGNLCI